MNAKARHRADQEGDFSEVVQGVYGTALLVRGSPSA